MNTNLKVFFNYFPFFIKKTQCQQKKENQSTLVHVESPKINPSYLKQTACIRSLIPTL